jgi:hypothetical protein
VEYDRLCEAVEKHFPDWVPAVNDARIFSMEGGGGGVELNNAFRSWQPDEKVIENFRLPFDVVAINHAGQKAASCVVLKTLDAGRRRYEAIGIMPDKDGGLIARGTLTAFPGEVVDSDRLGLACAVDEFEVHDWHRGKLRECIFYMRDITVCEARIHDNIKNLNRFTEASDVTVDGSCVRIKVGDEFKTTQNRRVVERARDELAQVIADAGDTIDVANANMGYLQLVRAVLDVGTICEPSKFIVEEASLDCVPRAPKSGKVVRSPYRPRYIVLSPGEIKKRYLYDEHDPTGIPKAPHERRGHYRRLQSERYVSKRGEVLWIKPCWVGKTEGVRGKNRYRVILDA